MHYTGILVTALAAISSVSAVAVAAPAEQRDRDRDDVFYRGECRLAGDELYCGRGVREFTRYDAGSSLCRLNNQANRVFCAVRNQQEFALQIAAEWSRIQRCAVDEYYDIGGRRCDCYGRRRDGERDRDRECRRRRGDRGDRDRYDYDRDEGREGNHGRERPDCHGDDIAFCAASEDLIVTYQRDNILCDRREGNYVFCAKPERGRAREKARDHFRDRRHLGLRIFKQADDDYVRVNGPGGFDAELLIDQYDYRIVVANIENPGQAFKAREALLSVWEDQSGTSASNLRRIKYITISEPSVAGVLDAIWEAYGKDPEDEDDFYIDSMTVERPGSNEENWMYDWLRNKNPFGSGAVSICIDYTETANHYIDSFTFGRKGYDGRWLEIEFGVN
ncbi:hypothetical protein CTRI78_v000274 [Colletotrichum trifolii]|uniref:Uncharacterized protein n=1 Tax=Colletotrichum trifolii TaxID=5466 RepID=A0A4V3HXY5_COLTR|nr:hypothetical protein CTRI78_v000274 [Colletotrichum trifolii]